MGEESTITYQAIYDLVRKEKTNDALQKLEPETYSQLIKYLRVKLQIYKNAKARKINPDELAKIKLQITSARKLIKELYERRERKILSMAINKSRTKSDIIDTSVLLPEEKLILEDTVKILDKYRKGILLNLVNAKLPFSKQDDKQEPAILPKDDNQLIRFTDKVPKFLGTNLEIYGPFKEGDMANLPKILANVLIKRGRALAIKN
jgi:DNA replication initiation complex subunit (GINS family)